MSTMVVVLQSVIFVALFISINGLKVDMNREYFYHGKDLFCAELKCTENIREDTQISALVNMSVYRISDPGGKILVAYISESDSKLQDYKRAGTRVEGKISKTISELEIFLSNDSACNDDIFLCEIHYVNTTGSIDRIGKQTERLPRKSPETFLILNLKVKTSDYAKSVDKIAAFLKSFEDPDRLKGADMTMSLQTSNSGGGNFSTDKSFDSTDTELSNSYKQISSSTFEDMLEDKIHNLTLDVNKTLQMIEKKLNYNTRLNEKRIAVLKESIKEKLANTQNQTEQLSIRLNEMETNIKKTVTGENMNSTLQLVGNINKTLQGFIDAYYDNPMNLKLTKQCARNDNSNLPKQTAVKLDERKLALCDTKTDGGGWIVIQRRVAGDVNFSRNWNDYKTGFGSLAGDYWLGNDWISNLTQNGFSELRFDMKYKGKSYYAVYSDVTVGNEAAFYRIKFRFKTSNVKNDFYIHNEMTFSTYDSDSEYYGNCAKDLKSGWWYNFCHSVNFNGEWSSTDRGKGIFWSDITGYNNSLEHVEMKLRRPLL